MGEVDFFLRIQIKQESRSTLISQSKCPRELVKIFALEILKGNHRQ